MTTSAITSASGATFLATSLVTVPIVVTSRSIDHGSASTFRGGPASRYRRVERHARRRPVRPNYAARRFGAVVAAVAAVATTVVLASVLDAVLVGPGGNPAFADGASPARQSRATVHVARAGDSLWSIADQYRGRVSRDRYLETLIDLNGSTTVVVGQAVALP